MDTAGHGGLHGTSLTDHSVSKGLRDGMDRWTLLVMGDYMGRP